MAGQIGHVGGLDIAPKPCSSCKMQGKDCLARLIRTSAPGRGKKQGKGGLACCTACANGNTHPMPGDKPCAEVGAEWAKNQ